jgi:hypothetical protein
MPQGCAWGLFDKDGKKDNLGCLNKITPAIVAAAATEVRDGISVSLNWPLDALKVPGLRKGLVHKHENVGDKFPGMNALDEELEFNTQSSSQWDGLIHWPHQPSGLSYNGFKPTVATLAASPTCEESGQEWPCMSPWHKRGGLVGRGVLLDYRAYAEAKGIPFSPFQPMAIRVADLEAVAAFQGTELKVGDILLVRTGFTEDLEGKNAAEQVQTFGQGAMAGVHGHVDTARWMWNHHFAAVASDNMAFEQLPPLKEDGTPDSMVNLGELYRQDPKGFMNPC